MSDGHLTMVETAALFILMAEVEPTPNVKLTHDYRCQLRKGSREKLERLKLIEVERSSGRLVLALGDRGWAHCATVLDAGAAPPSAEASRGSRNSRPQTYISMPQRSAKKPRSTIVRDHQLRKSWKSR